MEKFQMDIEDREVPFAVMELIEEIGNLNDEIRKLQQKNKVDKVKAVLDFVNELCKNRAENDNVVIVAKSLRTEWIKKWNENVNDVIIIDED